MQHKSIHELVELLKNINKPHYILMCGSVGAGKNYYIEKYLSFIESIDIDQIMMQLGNGIYSKSNISAAKLQVKTMINNNFINQKTFIHQGTSANLNNTKNKITLAKEYGFNTILFYVDTPIAFAYNNIVTRVNNGGHGNTISLDKIIKTYNGAKYTFDYATSHHMDGLDYYVKIR